MPRLASLLAMLLTLISLQRPASAAIDAPAVQLRVSANLGSSAGFEAGLGLSMMVNAPLVAGIAVMPFALLRGGTGNPMGMIVQGIFLFGGIACIGAGIGDLVGGILLYRSGGHLTGAGREAYEASLLKGTALGLGLHGAVFTALGAGLISAFRGQGNDSLLRESRALEVAAYVSLGVGLAQLVSAAVLAYGGYRRAGRLFRRIAIAPQINSDGSAGLVVAGAF